MTLRFYFSRKNAADYPATTAYAKRVRDLLGHYAALSKGKIVLEDVDPEPFTCLYRHTFARPSARTTLRSAAWKCPRRGLVGCG